MRLEENLNATCKGIAKDLEDVVNGAYVKEEYGEWDLTAADDDREAVTLSDFFDGAKEIIVARSTSSPEIKFSRWEIEIAGTDVWVDTEKREVTLRYEGVDGRCPIPAYVCSAVDAFAEDVDARKGGSGWKRKS